MAEAQNKSRNCSLCFETFEGEGLPRLFILENHLILQNSLFETALESITWRYVKEKCTGKSKRNDFRYNKKNNKKIN